MEEQEPPIEQVHHDIHHHAETSGVRWISWVALSTAVLAALAAVASLHSGHDSNEATLEQIRASDNWAYYQAKGVKAAVLSSKLDVLTAMGKEPPAEERAKLADYQREQDEISREAKAEETASRAHLARHVAFSRSVTFFQVAIAVAAISVLTRRQVFWFVGLAFGLGGIAFMTRALLMTV